MGERWRKFREGTIGSQVIAALIVAAILTVLSWLASIFTGDTIFKLLLPAWLGIATEVPVPVWAILLCLVAVAFAIRFAHRRKAERAALTEERERQKIRIASLSESLSKALADLTEMEESVKSARRLADQGPDRLAPRPRAIHPEFAPSDDQRRALVYLLHVYPTKKQLGQIHEFTRSTTPAHTEQELDGLLAAHVISLETQSGYYGLTRNGRDAAMSWCGKMEPRPRASRGYYD